MKGKALKIRALLCVGLIAVFLAAPMVTQAAPPLPGSPAAPVPVVAVGPARTVVNAPLGLKLRNGYSLTSSVVLVLYNGQTVYELASPVWNQGISWTKVRAYRWGYYYDGWCATAYLSSYGGWAATGETGLKVTATGGLRLRSGAGLGYAIQRIVPSGTILAPTGAGSVWNDGIQWTQVYLNGAAVWGASDYLTAV